MNTISTLAGRDLSPPSYAVGETSKQAQATTNQPSKIEHRVNQLQKNTLHLAQDFLSQFANQLFGDAAKGMQVNFDQIELSASSEASMSLAHSSNGTSQTQAANFNLNDSSSFTGKGTLTTADGRQFEFELSVTYESRQSYTREVTQNTKAPTSNELDPPPKKMHFNGTADDLLNSISAEPVRLPFKLQDQDQKGLGDMVLKLLNLNGGDRFFDWFGTHANKIDQEA